MTVVEFFATVAKKGIEIELTWLPKYGHVMFLVPDFCGRMKTTYAMQLYDVVLMTLRIWSLNHKA